MTTLITAAKETSGILDDKSFVSRGNTSPICSVIIPRSHE